MIFRKKELLKNPFLFFVPFLVLYVLFVLLTFKENEANIGDAQRYLIYANNILNGFYSPPYPNVMLTNTPGYPLFIAPFVGLNIPLLFIVLLNPILYYLSIVFLFKTVNRFSNQRMAFIAGIGWGLYYVAYQTLALIHTESLTFFLMAVMAYSLIRSFDHRMKKSLKWDILSGVLIGAIVLTKLAFGYVMLVMLLGSTILFLFRPKNNSLKKSFVILSFAFLSTVPYLAYTYSLTGNLFYWGTSGGDTLYWMSNPNKGEYGDWKAEGLSQNSIAMGNYNIPNVETILESNHKDILDKIGQYSDFADRDSAYKAVALNNIKSNPLKFAENCVYNMGRLLFHYPFSYAVQRPKTLLIFPANGIIFTFMLLCLFLTVNNWRVIDTSIKFLLFFIFLYLGLSTIGSALVRMFTIIVPLLIIWFAYILDKSVKLNLKFES